MMNFVAPLRSVSSLIYQACGLPALMAATTAPLATPMGDALGVAYSILYSLGAILIGLFGISFLVGIHELGHFFACKLFGVHTPSFSIGFGPRLISKKIGTTEFSFSLLPLGGYVEIAGLQEVGQGEQLAAQDVSFRSFAAQPYLAKMLILFGGIIVNMLFAYVTLTLLLTRTGLPASGMLIAQAQSSEIATVLAKSPAEQAGLLPHDRITAVNSIPLPLEQPIAALLCTLQQHAGETITVTVDRTSDATTQSISLPVTLNNATSNAQLGVTFTVGAIPQQGIFAALRTSGSIIYSWILGTFTTLRTLLPKRTAQGTLQCGSTRSLGGPVAVIHGIAQSLHQGFATFLLILCFISVGLACLNIVPLPIFDGGQAVFYTLEALAGRSLESVRIVIHYACWILVLFAFVYLSWQDITRIISGS